MDIPDPRGRGSFWEAYRACPEENRVRPDRSAFYVNWARDFANLLPENPFPNIDMVRAPGSIQPRSSCYGRTLSKKDTLVKIFGRSHNP
jgi:hypothetical protein